MEMKSSMAGSLMPLQALENLKLVNQFTILHNMRFSTSPSNPHLPDVTVRKTYLLDLITWVSTQGFNDWNNLCQTINNAFHILWSEAQTLWITDIMCLIIWSCSLFPKKPGHPNKTLDAFSLERLSLSLFHLLLYISYHWSPEQFQEILNKLKTLNVMEASVCQPSWLSLSFSSPLSLSSSVPVSLNPDLLAEYVLHRFDSLFGCSLRSPSTHTSFSLPYIPKIDVTHSLKPACSFDPFVMLSFYSKSSQVYPPTLPVLVSLSKEVIPFHYFTNRLLYWFTHGSQIIYLLCMAQLLSSQLRDYLKPIFLDFLDGNKESRSINDLQILFLSFLRCTYTPYTLFIDEVINQDSWGIFQTTTRTTTFFTWLREIVIYESDQTLRLHLKHIQLNAQTKSIYETVYYPSLLQKIGEPQRVYDEVSKEAKLILSSLRRSNPTSSTSSIPTRVHNLLLIKKNWFLEKVLPYLFEIGDRDEVHDLMQALWNTKKIPPTIWQAWILFQSKQTQSQEEKNLLIRNFKLIDQLLLALPPPSSNALSLSYSLKGYLSLILTHGINHQCELDFRGTLVHDLNSLEPLSRATQILWNLHQQIPAKRIELETVHIIVFNLLNTTSIYIPFFNLQPTPLFKAPFAVFTHFWDYLLWPWLMKPISPSLTSLTNSDHFILNLIAIWSQLGITFTDHKTFNTATNTSWHQLVYAKLIFWQLHSDGSFTPLSKNHPILLKYSKLTFSMDLAIFWSLNLPSFTIQEPISSFLEQVLIFPSLPLRPIICSDLSDLETAITSWIPFQNEFSRLLDWMKMISCANSCLSFISKTWLDRSLLKINQLYGPEKATRFENLFLSFYPICRKEKDLALYYSKDCP